LSDDLYPFGKRIDQYDDGIVLASPRLIKACISRLEEYGSIAVVGSDGSGKFALLRALVTELRIKSVSVNSQHWDYYVVRPGSQPKVIHDAEWTCVAAGPKATDSQPGSMAQNFEQAFRNLDPNSDAPALLIV